MGFFSWICCGCQRPVLVEPASRFLIPAASQVVLLLPDGSHIIGTYDGYGAVDSYEMPDCIACPRWFHKRCYAYQLYDATPPAVDDPAHGFFYEDEQLAKLFPPDWFAGYKTQEM